MPTRARHIVTILTVALAGCGLTGCGTINEKLAAGVSDAIPAAIFSLILPQPARPQPARATVSSRMIWRALVGIGRRLRPDSLWMMDLGSRREQARRFFVDGTS